MERVPKIVRERLRAAESVGNHPDPDMLAAFSERSLAQRERTQVLNHLARCGDCRDVVALALPASEAVQVVRDPAPKSWLAWPTLRWGFVSAGIVLVASFGVLQYRKQARTETIASRSAAPVVAPQQAGQQESKSEEPQKKALAIPPSDAAANPEKYETALVPEALKSDSQGKLSKTPARRDESGSAVRGQSTSMTLGGPLPHGPRVANQMQLNANTQQQNAFFPAVATSPPPAPVSKQKASADFSAKSRVLSQPQRAEVAAEASPVNAQADSLSGAVIQNQPLDAQSLNGGQGDARLNPPKPSAAYSTSSKIAGRATQGIGGTMGAGMKVPNPRWSINASGALQRSLDQGSTWQDVNVGDSLPAAPASMMLAANKRAKELHDKDAEDKIERSKSASIVFRAVSANGPDVWAGGSGGMLYHSTDSGANWTRVIPSVPGATLTGEITTVAFTDVQHGKVSTSTSELWSTQDGGQTWEKQSLRAD